MLANGKVVSPFQGTPISFEEGKPVLRCGRRWLFLVTAPGQLNGGSPKA
jgi:hypothetical protein